MFYKITNLVGIAEVVTEESFINGLLRVENRGFYDISLLFCIIPKGIPGIE